MNHTPDEILERYRQLEAELAALIGPLRFSAAINLRLERITHLMAELGNPQRAFPAIHVAGTSGKGSVAAMAAAILTAAGYKTGLHLSPHLQILNERHQINGRMAPTSRLARLFDQMKPALETVATKNPFGRPSYFEAQVALAFLLFQFEAVDAAVVEVGLGGTLDATNVLPAQVAVLTNVGLDHTAILGDSVEEIARDKIGIVKPGQVVINGATQSSVQAIVTEQCAEQGATLWQMGIDFNYEIQRGNGEKGDLLTVHFPHMTVSDLELGLHGRFQAHNAALAATAAYALPEFTIPNKALRAGLAQVRLPGRMEQVQQEPMVILDGAHNPDKIQAAAQALKQIAGDRRRIVVLGLKSDKAAADLLPYVLENTDRLITTAFRLKGLWEPFDPAALAALASEYAPELAVESIADPQTAVEAALAAAGPDHVVWVTGSLYLVGDVRERWYPSARLLIEAEGKGAADAP